MSRSKNQDVALALLNTISSMYGTFANKQLADEQIIARQEAQQMQNAHLLEVKQYDDNLKMQQTELYRAYSDGQKDMDELKRDVEKLGLDLYSDFIEENPDFAQLLREYFDLNTAITESNSS